NLFFYRPSIVFRSWRRTMYDSCVIISSWKNSQMTPLNFFCRSSDWMARVRDIDGRLSPVMAHQRGWRTQPLKGHFLNVLPYLSGPPGPLRPQQQDKQLLFFRMPPGGATMRTAPPISARFLK